MAIDRIEGKRWSAEAAGFTADEFIAWALEQPTGRFEL